MVIESKDLEAENKYLIEKYRKGKEVQDSLNQYNNELSTKRMLLEREISELRERTNNQKCASEQNNNEQSMYDSKVRNQSDKLIEAQRINISLKAKIESLRYEASKNKEMIGKERQLLSTNINKNNIYDVSRVNVYERLERLKTTIDVVNKELSSVLADKEKYDMDYEVLENVTCELNLKLSKVNKNNTLLYEHIEELVSTIEERADKITKKNTFLNSTSEVKVKVMDSLRKIASFKKTFDLMKEKNN